jgi:heat-inducible transcriptional repressor
MNITQRQERILLTIIKEFLDTAQAVGSLTLSEKYDMGVSPATLRAEMARLVDGGYLYKEHLSSGRIPTTLGLRYFIDVELQEEDLDKIKETQLKEKLFQNRFNKARFLNEAVKSLADVSNLAAISLVDHMVFSSGFGHLVAQPEFLNHDLLESAFDILESEAMLLNIFRRIPLDKDVRIVVGDEIGVESLNECSIICAPFNFFRGTKGYLATVGPRRIHYAKIIPAVRLISHFIQEAISGWE